MIRPRVCRGIPFGLLFFIGVVGCESGIFVPENGPFLSRVQAGFDFTCALDRAGAIACWGRNGQGQLGIGPDTTQIVPVQIASDERFVSLSTKASGAHACAVNEDGVVFCWGENGFGQLGDGSTVDHDVPLPVTGGVEFRTVAAGWRFTCGLTRADDAYCWGRGEWGQLGDGNATNSTSPVPVAGGHKFTHIEVGSNNLVCGLTRGRAVLCWGLDFSGSLGSTSTEICTRSDGLMLPCATIPQPVDSEMLFTSITVGNSFACAVDFSAQGWCWGANGSGQLGSPSTTRCPTFINETGVACNPVPTLVDGDLNFATISAGTSHTCAVTTAGAGYCWGFNQFGQRGDGLLGNTSSTPAAIAGGLEFTAVSAGANHSCGETTGGGLWCWGANDAGQLGTGNNNLELAPASVVQ